MLYGNEIFARASATTDVPRGREIAFISNSGFVTEWTAEQLDADTILPKPNISNISWVDYGVDDDGSSNATTGHSKHSDSSAQRAWRSQNDDEMTE